MLDHVTIIVSDLATSKRFYRMRRAIQRIAPGALSAAVAMSALIAVAPAAAATPSGGCWGTCGGDDGPVGGYFTVQHRRVQGFAVELRCLGSHQVKQPVGPPISEGDPLSIAQSMAITSRGAFSFSGSGSRVAGGRQYRVHVRLTGMFVSRRQAHISLMVGYGRCGTQRLVVHSP